MHDYKKSFAIASLVTLAAFSNAAAAPLPYSAECLPSHTPSKISRAASGEMLPGTFKDAVISVAGKKGQKLETESYTNFKGDFTIKRLHLPEQAPKSKIDKSGGAAAFLFNNKRHTYCPISSDGYDRLYSQMHRRMIG